jgi:hypothetical protein
MVALALTFKAFNHPFWNFDGCAWSLLVDQTTAPQWSQLLSTANFNWLIQLSPDIQKIPKNYQKSDKKFENPAKSCVPMSCKHFENPAKTDKSDIVAALTAEHILGTWSPNNNVARFKKSNIHSCKQSRAIDAWSVHGCVGFPIPVSG